MILSNTSTNFASQLAKLVLVRWFYIIGQLIAMSSALYLYQEALPMFPLIGIMLIHIIANAVGLYQQSKPETVTQNTLWWHLLSDVFTLSGLLYFIGGGTSGFVSVLLIPIALAALLCSQQRAIVAALLAITSYSLMMKFYQPLGHDHAMNHGSLISTGSMQSHYLGMWFTFFISTLLLLFFISGLSKLLKSQQQWIAKQKEKQMNDQHLVDLALNAANLAHQLSTPLNSLELIAEELEESKQSTHLIPSMRKSLDQCRHSLEKLRDSAEANLAGGRPWVSYTELKQRLIQNWLHYQPHISLVLNDDQLTTEQKGWQFASHQGLASAIVHLFENSIKHQSENPNKSLNVLITADQNQIIILFENKTDTLTEQIVGQLGEQPVSSVTGLGLGFYLSNQTLQQLNGSVSLTLVRPNTARTEIRLTQIKQQ